MIESVEFSIDEWLALDLFHSRFMLWLTQDHLDDANAMAGRPMTEVFNAEDARIALRYVDEFVAQDDRYPVTN